MKAKNILKTLALPVAVALGMMATSCSSDDNFVNEQQAGAAGYEIPVTVSATRSGDEGTRATFNETSRELEFEEGDKLFIRGSHGTAGTFAGVLSNTSGAPGTFSGTVTTQHAYTGTSADLFGSAASLTATLLPKDYSTIGYLTLLRTGANQMLTVAEGKAFVTAASADAAKKKAIEQLSLERAETYDNGFALQAKNAIINYAISSLSASTSYSPSITDGTTTVSGSVDSDTDGKAYFAVGFTVDGSTSKDYTLTGVGVAPSSVPAKAFSVSSGTITASGKTLEPNKVYNKTATAPAIEYVKFSTGNLQYQASTGTWRFAENQYDYVGDGGTNGGNVTGSDNASISETYTGWIDLFGWGTSGYQFASGYGSAYQPWATSTSAYDYGPSGAYNLTGDYANGDWGVNIGSGWRTLSKDEWVYLFNTRTVNNGTGSGKSYTLGQEVNDVLGVVLYPDDYTGAAYATGSNWSTFESAGCVFLPAAGYRGDASVSLVGSCGDYWSSTAYGTDGAAAYIVEFFSGNVFPASSNGRSYGYSVRLVRPVE